MKTLRMVMAAFVVLCLGGIAQAADNKDNLKKKIVGKWEATKVEENTLPKGTKVEFTADGKLKVIIVSDGKDNLLEGTYVVDGDNTFSYTLKIGEMELNKKITVKKISDSELDTVNPDNKNVVFKKVK